MTTIFITDIHGNYNVLKDKMDYMLKKYPHAEIVFGGDYVMNKTRGIKNV